MVRCRTHGQLSALSLVSMRRHMKPGVFGASLQRPFPSGTDRHKTTWRNSEDSAFFLLTALTWRIIFQVFSLARRLVCRGVLARCGSLGAAKASNLSNGVRRDNLVLDQSTPRSSGGCATTKLAVTGRRRVDTRSATEFLQQWEIGDFLRVLPRRLARLVGCRGVHIQTRASGQPKRPISVAVAPAAVTKKRTP